MIARKSKQVLRHLDGVINFIWTWKKYLDTMLRRAVLFSQTKQNSFV